MRIAGRLIADRLHGFFWNAAENRLRAGWRLLLQLTMNIGGTLFFSFWVVPHTPLAVWPRLTVEAIGYPVLLGITLSSVWLAGRFLDRRDWSDFGLTLTQRTWWEDFGAGCAIGFMLIVLFLLTATALGIIRLTLSFTSGIPGQSFPVAVVFGLLSYGSVGFFEELARAYQIRNLFEGLRGARWELWRAAVAAAAGAAVISAVMHGSGMPVFILFVFVSMAFQGLFYLFTGRTALITGYHFAWDFTLATIFGIEALSAGEYTGLFTPSLTSFIQMNDSGVQIANYLPLALMAVIGAGLQLGAWLALLGWVRWRSGGVRVRAEMAHPTLRERGRINQGARSAPGSGRRYHPRARL